jgi:acid phosphatase
LGNHGGRTAPVFLFIAATIMGALFIYLTHTGSVAQSNAAPSAAQIALLQQKIQHVIVIYEENWSFDGLYGQFPGVNGPKGAVTPQVQCPTGTTGYVPLTGLPPAFIATGGPTGPWPCGWQGLSGGVQDKRIPLGLPLKPYDLTSSIASGSKTGDLWHIFWHEQLQIDNGALEPSNGTPMGKFSAWADNPGLTFSYYNATHMPEGAIAQHYTIADNFFHSVFGGSYLNHQWLICACTPQWNQPLPASPRFVATWNPATKTLLDGNVTTLPRPGTQGSPLWVVNTTYSVNQPRLIPYPVPTDQFLRPIPPTQKTIGDLLTDHQPAVSWKWYSGDWDLALRNSPQALNCGYPLPSNPFPPQDGDCFQSHHQPFVYFARWGTDGSPEKAAHLQDEKNFLADLQSGNLPSVSFVKPVGLDNEHPAYSSLLRGQLHLRDLIAAVCSSRYWPSTAVIIAYDENGGRWDHVAPPKIDEWGPGTRVPAIIISPYAKPHNVDHTQYETVSILSLIEKLFALPALNSRDANASPLLNAFNFTQAPLACQSS